jgi:choline dehydrogenase-like flavoprotein
VVVAGGAIHSSLLLMRSGMGGRRVGQGLGMNIGAPLTADFPGIVNAHAGLQISHYLTQSPELGYILETWWNPPTSQALAMPGWFETHYHNMKRYAHMVGVGVLVPSDAKGRVKSGGLTGRTIDFKPTKKDVDRIIDAVVKAGEIFLAAGAERVLPHTFQELSYTSADDMKRNFPAQVRDAGDLFLGTGHPQGGNAMSEDPARGVVDGRLRVHGYDNVWIADASVFPDAIGVNPQVTVMALAHYGAQHVADA